MTVRATTLHATVVGVDRPGVTQAMFAALGDSTVLDVEQVVVAGQLVLGTVVLAQLSDAPRLLADLQAAVPDFDVTLRQVHSIDVAGAITNAIVTIVGAPVRAADVSALSGVIAGLNTNIVRIDRVADYPVTALALEVATRDLGELRNQLNLRSRELSVDIAVAAKGLTRRGVHLVVMDVDSTLIQDEVIEILARFAGREAEVREITEAAMRGELDFAQSLHARVATLAGLPASVLARARGQIRLTPGARTLCRTLRLLGYRIALVSGGFTEVIAPLADELGVDHLRANGLEVVDGKLTGRLRGPIIDRAAKAAALREFAAAHDISQQATIAIGDGANDLDMLAAAGHGIAFNAKPVVQDAADAAINVPYLDTVLYLMGITREEVEIANTVAVNFPEALS